MLLIALRDLPPNDDATARALAGALEVTALEARGRLSVQGGGPAVVARRGAVADADALAARLRDAGFHPLVVDHADAETDATRFVVRRFTFDDGGLQAEARDGSRRVVAWADVRLLLRATGISIATTTETTKGRQFSPGRAVLSGGLMMTKEKTTERTTTSESWDGCLFVYPRGGTSLAFREPEVLYDGLGAALAPTRQANFAKVCEVFRARCGGARHDDRLIRRAGQTQLLGPGLPPESNLDLALAILAATL